MIRNYFTLPPKIIIEEAFEGVLHIYDQGEGEMWTSATNIFCKFGDWDVEIYCNPKADVNMDRGIYMARIPILGSHLQFSRWTPESFAKALDTVLGRLYNNRLKLNGEGFWVEGHGDLEFIPVDKIVERAMRGGGSALEVGRSVHQLVEHFVGHPRNNNTFFEIRSQLTNQMRRVGVAIEDTADAMSSMNRAFSSLQTESLMGPSTLRNPCGEIGFVEEEMYRSLGVPLEFLEDDDNYSSS